MAQSEDSGAPVAEQDSGAADVAAPPACPPPSGPPHVLIVGRKPEKEELVVFDYTSRTIAKRIPVTSHPARVWTSNAPYLLEPNRVTRVDPATWESSSSWSLPTDDVITVDAGNGDVVAPEPIAVVTPACGNGYVIRQNSNRIAVIDTAKKAIGSAPEKYIDLASLLHPTDSDGLVDVSGAVYVPSTKRIYVLLGNYDRNRVVSNDEGLLARACLAAKPSIIAIDATTDTLVSLGGTRPGGGIELAGSSPTTKNALNYDAQQNRLVVTLTGCLEEGVGDDIDIVRQGVEFVDLASGRVSAVADKRVSGSQTVFMDADRAALFGPGYGFFWDPKSITPPVALPEDFRYHGATHDGAGNLIFAALKVDMDADASKPFISELYRVPYKSGPEETSVVVSECELRASDLLPSDDLQMMPHAAFWPPPR